MMWQNYASGEMSILVKSSYSKIYLSIAFEALEEYKQHYTLKDLKTNKIPSPFNTKGSIEYAKLETSSENTVYRSLGFNPINYLNPPNNQFAVGTTQLAFHKRKFFKPEAEYRLAFIDSNLKDNEGWKVYLDPKIFIQEIILPPYKEFKRSEITELKDVLEQIDPSHKNNKSGILRYSSLESNLGDRIVQF